MAKYVERLISVDLAGDCGRHWRRRFAAESTRKPHIGVWRGA